MQEIGGMHQVERIEQGGRDAVQLLLRGRLPEVCEPGFEALASLERHHHVDGGVCLEHAQDSHNAAVIEAGERAGLRSEAEPSPFENFLVAVRPGLDVQV